MEWLPLTASVAIGLFFLKELFEFVRRWRANHSKLQGLKHLLKAECERNKWAFDQLTNQISKVSDILKIADYVEIADPNSAKPRLAIGVEGSESSSVIWPVHRSVIDKYLFEAASLDRKLFLRMEAMAVALSEVDHVRSNFIELVSTELDQFEGFAGYADEEIGDATKALQSLYRVCAGTTKVERRVR